MTKLRLGFLGMVFTALLALCIGAHAQEDEQSIGDLLADLEQAVLELRTLSERIDTAPERHREALVYRRDERSLALLKQLARVVRRAAEFPEDDPERREVVGRLEQDLAGASNAVVSRLADLGKRIDENRTELDALSAGEHVVMEASIHSLERMRFQYYEALVEIVNGRKSLGISVDNFSEELAKQLFLGAETLVGRLEFTGSSLAEIKRRLKSDVDNSNLQSAARDLSARQEFDVERLRKIADLIEDLGLDATAYTSVLLKQADGLSLDTLERGALISVLSDGWDDMRESLTARAPDLIFKLLVFLLVLLVFRALSRLTRRAVRAACERPGVEMSTLLKDVTVSVSGGTVMGIGILMALSQVGISLGPMLAGLGVAGFIVGFALQDTLGNFAAGGMILIYRPYDVDDFVEVAGASGLVKKMSLVSTTIATFDNQTLVVPNSKIWGDVIKNVTAQKLRRVDLVFGIGYGDDIERAEQVLEAVLDGNEMVLSKPAAMVKVHELGDSSVNFVVRPWVKTEDYWDVYWDITREVKLRFDREGISIPFPQRDVHIHREEG